MNDETEHKCPVCEAEQVGLSLFDALDDPTIETWIICPFCGHEWQKPMKSNSLDEKPRQKSEYGTGNFL